MATTQPTIKRHMDTKLWFIYSTAIKRNEIVTFVAVWMDLEIIISREVSQAEKDKYHVISLIC